MPGRGGSVADADVDVELGREIGSAGCGGSICGPSSIVGCSKKRTWFGGASSGCHLGQAGGLAQCLVCVGRLAERSSLGRKSRRWRAVAATLERARQAEGNIGACRVDREPLRSRAATKRRGIEGACESGGGTELKRRPKKERTDGHKSVMRPLLAVGEWENPEGKKKEGRAMQIDFGSPYNSWHRQACPEYIPGTYMPASRRLGPISHGRHCEASPGIYFSQILRQTAER